MSKKKKKNKFKKIKKNKKTSLNKSFSPLKESPVRNDLGENLPSSSPDIKETVLERKKETIEIPNDEKYIFVRRDVRKILLITFFSLVILTTAYFLNLKTTILSSFGDWIYNISNIQTP